MADDAVRMRSATATLSTIVLAAATVYASKSEHLAKSFDAQPHEWVDRTQCGSYWPDDSYEARVEAMELSAGWDSRDCVSRDDDDACFRELYRAQLEALDGNRLYADVL